MNNILIIGGGTSIGYCLNRELRRKSNNRVHIVDFPLENKKIFVSSKNIYTDGNDFTKKSFRRYSI